MRTKLRNITAKSNKNDTAVKAKGRGARPTMDDAEKAYALEVAGRIKQARKEAGLTQVELAELIDASDRAMQGYENAEVIPYKKMLTLSRVLNRPLEWLLRGDDNILPSEEKLEAITRDLKNLTRMVETVLSKLE